MQLNGPSEILIKQSGVALREPHFSFFEQRQNQFRALEVIFENYLFTQGERRRLLLDLSRDHSIHLHGVSTNIGSFDPLNVEMLRNLRALADETGSKLLSDHLCFTRLNQKSTFELLPIPKTRNMLQQVGDRLDQVREILGQDFLLENISSYFTYKVDEMSELEFMSELHKTFGARYLLDVNNLFVNSVNLEYSAEDFIAKLPKDSVAAYHVAGHERVEDFLFDTHGAAIPTEVQRLFQLAVDRFGPHPTFLERDENVPMKLGPLEAELKSVLTLGARP